MICQRFEVDSVQSGDAYYDRTCYVCYEVAKARALKRIGDGYTNELSGIGFNEMNHQLHRLEVLEIITKTLRRGKFL